MTKKEVQHYWNYFCSLTKRLQSTIQYVDHSANDEGELKNGSVCSFEFQQIITLAAIEFENICKVICLDIDSNFSYQYADIKKITKEILKKYPRIIETEVKSDYQVLKPLKNWKIDKDEQSRDKVFGLTWWDDYSDLKHQTFKKFELATLDNAVNSVASLMVMELYLIRIMLGTVETLLLDTKCDYFVCGYAGDFICTSGELLPDFQEHNENKDSVQV